MESTVTTTADTGGGSWILFIIVAVIAIVVIVIIVAIVVAVRNSNNDSPHSPDCPGGDKCPKEPKCPKKPHPKDPKEPKHPKNPKNPKDPKDPKDPKHPKDPKDPGHQHPKPKDPGHQHPKPKDPGHQHPKPKDPKPNDPKHPKDPKDPKGRDAGEVLPANHEEKYKLPDLASKPEEGTDDGSLTSVSLIGADKQPDITGVQRSSTVATAEFLKTNMGKLDVPGNHNIEIPSDVSVGAMLEAFGIAKADIEHRQAPPVNVVPTPVVNHPVVIKPVAPPTPVPSLFPVPATHKHTMPHYMARVDGPPVPVEIPQMIVHHPAVPKVVPLPGNPESMASSESIADSTGNSVTGAGHTTTLPVFNLSSFNQPVVMNLTHTSSSLSD